MARFINKFILPLAAQKDILRSFTDVGRDRPVGVLRPRDIYNARYQLRYLRLIRQRQRHLQLLNYFRAIAPKTEKSAALPRKSK